MPFHIPHHRHTQSDTQYNHDNYYGAANAIYSAGQTLSSVGAPNPHYDTSSQHTPNQPNNANGQDTVIAYRPGPAQTGRPNTQGGHYEQSGLRRSGTIGRQQAEELHMNLNQQGNAMSDVHHYGAPPAYAGDGLSSTPQFPNPSSQPVPGTLQPGGIAARPATLGSSSAAPSLSTLPQISTQHQQSPLSARPVTLNHTHSYSHSSPGAMDQPKYKPFTHTPEQSKYPSSQNSYMPPTPSGPSSYSPLGLADIRQRTDLPFADLQFSHNVAQEQETAQYPQTSNYAAPWPIYAVDWCKWPPRSGTGSSGKVAIGSYLEDNHNYIQILDTQRSQLDPDNPHAERGIEFVKTAEATHAYPVTRILWEPPSSNKQTTDLLATSGDHLRLWSLPNDGLSYGSNSISRSANTKTPPLQKLSPLALLSNSKSPEHTAPITSLDWNVVQPSLIITSSIDTTCTIWDIPTLTAKTQLIAHDKEVYDVRFCANSVDVFVSCGADGSVRMFDLRSLEHSTIIYEPSEKQQADKAALDNLSSSPTRQTSNNTVLPFPPPLLRIAASPHDAHLLATFSQDSAIIRVLDVRQPGQALLELQGHGAGVNCIDWSATQRGVLASGADDCCVLLWDLMGSSAGGNVVGGVVPSAGVAGAGAAVQGQQSQGQERGPSAVWECDFEVSNLSWAPGGGGGSSTLGVCGGRGLWGVQL